MTLVSWGAMLHETLAAADGSAQDGIRCEVIDVATLKPLDVENHSALGRARPDAA